MAGSGGQGWLEKCMSPVLNSTQHRYKFHGDLVNYCPRSFKEFIAQPSKILLSFLASIPHIPGQMSTPPGVLDPEITHPEHCVIHPRGVSPRFSVCLMSAASCEFHVSWTLRQEPHLSLISLVHSLAGASGNGCRGLGLENWDIVPKVLHLPGPSLIYHTGPCVGTDCEVSCDIETGTVSQN